jgi:hypothetical protein
VEQSCSLCGRAVGSRERGREVKSLCRIDLVRPCYRLQLKADNW